MIEFVRRHVFLLGLVAGVVVVALVSGLVIQFMYRSESARLGRMLQTAEQRATALKSGPNYTKELVAKMADEVGAREKSYEQIVAFIRDLGSRREPLVKDLFPVTTNIGLLHSFKAEYDVKLAQFMKDLGAVEPSMPEGEDVTAAEIDAKQAEIDGATMFAHRKQSFSREDWVDRREAPPMELVRYGQENVWLMEDVVGIIARMNEDYLRDRTPSTKTAPIKELVQIRIGSQYASFEGGRMSGGSGRYRAGQVFRGRRGSQIGRAQSLTGRGSRPGLYRVLPFRLVVVVEARLAGALIRRLKGTESFITVEAWRLRPITEVSFARARDRLAPEWKYYGGADVVRLEILGESLIFQLEGGRITTLPQETTGVASAVPTAK